MPSKKTQAELVQEQINSTGRDLGRVAESVPLISSDGGRVDSVLTPSEDIIWKRSYFIENQDRCINYDSLTSGFSRGTDHGWCALANLATDPGSDAGVDTHGWLDARQKWLRSAATPRCLQGELTTCSGYGAVEYYVPHVKQFRSTSKTVHNDFMVSNRGEISLTELPADYVGMFSVEVKQNTAAPISIPISTADSVGLFVSGHNMMNSGRIQNYNTRVDVNIPEDEWVRLDFVYYSPMVSGRFNFGKNLIDKIDAWRTPSVPDEVGAFYTTFARKESGSFAKLSYVMAQMLPPDDDTIDFVEVEWRAPNLIPQWRRVTFGVDTPQPPTLISGLIQVPHTEDIEIRSRAINQWGDAGNWHTVSGFVSAAGNIKPALPSEDMIAYSLTRGPGTFDFSIFANQTEDWSSFIVVSGYQHDHYVETSSMFSGANAGDRELTLIGAPTIMTSGMLLTINGGYQSDSGELHIIEHADSTSATIRLKEPITQGLNAGYTVKAYNIAKETPDTEFGVLSKNADFQYFNVVGKNHNGGISAFADDISAWQSMRNGLTVNNVLVQGPNLLRNGSFEKPRYTDTAATDIGLGAGRPLSWWFSTSGNVHGGSGNATPAVVDNVLQRHGSQSIRMLITPPSMDYSAGEHNDLSQDIYGAGWNQDYILSLWRFCYDNAGSSFTSTSGIFRWKYEVWAYDNTEKLGIDFQYEDLPPSAEFLYSGHYVDLMEKKPYNAAENNWHEEDRLYEVISVSGSSSQIISKYPLIRISFWNTEESLLATWPDYDAGDLFSPTIYLDQASFNTADPHYHTDEAVVDGRSFDWETIRTNERANTDQGDHLDIDEVYGLNVVRRDGNAVSIARQTPSSMGQFEISGHLDIPRMVAWHPNAASVVNSHVSHASQSPLMFNGVLVVPSGRCLMFDISPNRTFEYNTNNEVTIIGRTVGFMVPSGGAQYSGTWYDPGIHSVYQVKEVVYDIIGGSTGLVATAGAPIVAYEDDIQVGNIYLRCYTAFGEPGTGTSPANETAVYWHACDVKIWETSAPFVSSGVNGVGGNNVGYSTKNGLTFFESTSTSVNREA